MTSFTSLRQVHLTYYFSDPSKSTDECRSLRLRPHCWNAVAPVPPVQPEQSASLSRVSCDMTETVQNQPNKTFFFWPWWRLSVAKATLCKHTCEFLRGQVQNSKYLQVPRVQAEPKSWPQRLPVRRERREKTAMKVTKIQQSGEQTPAEYLQQFFPTLTCLHANVRITCSHLTNQQQLPLCCFFF